MTSKIYLASVIINNYNYGRYLKEAIDSALGQTYLNTEVIVVDDGSTDNSPAIIASYGERIIPVLKENGGQASAFNAGFKVSQGEVIIFLDSDDTLLPTAVEKAAELFGDPDVVKVHWPLWEFDVQGRKTGRMKPDRTLSQGDLREVVICTGPSGYAWPPTSGNAWSRRFLQSIAPIPEKEYQISADTYLSALVPIFGCMKSIVEPQGCYRIHGRNNYYGNTSDARLRGDLQRWEHAYHGLARLLEARGINVDLEAWKGNSWFHQLYLAMQQIAALVPPGDRFILVDEDQWETGEIVVGHRRIPFLEKGGQYWGPPPDDETAIREFERLRQTGASFMVFAWPAFWWLDYYSGLNNDLRSNYRCVLENERLVVFDLRPYVRSR